MHVFLIMHIFYNPGLKTIPSKTHLHGILTKPVSTKGPIIDDDDDNASLASSDSEEFWDDYCDKIESLVS
jgi:hypothetical protein